MALEVEPHRTGRISKTEAKRCAFFVLRDEASHVLRATFVTKHEGVLIAIHANFINFRKWPQHSDANRGETA